jgi:hypothetical protein
MRRVAVGVMGMIVLAAATTMQAQRGERPVQWLPAADSLPANMVTLVVLDEGTRAPVDHPLVCQPDGGWMVGMADGRLRFGGSSMPDTVRIRILGPLHEPRAVSFTWAEAHGRAVIVTLARRPGGRVEPDC